MPSINFQFHTTPVEMIKCADGFAAEHDLMQSYEVFFPEYRAVAQGSVSRNDDWIEEGQIRRVALSLVPLDNGAQSTMDFIDRNPDALLLTIGASSENSIRESAITASTENVDALKLWRKLVRELKSTLKTGATLVGVSGHTKENESHRFSDGALALSKKGVVMLAAAGGTQFRFHH